MVPIVAPRIEAYAAKSSVPEHPLLKALAHVTYAVVPQPQMQVGCLEGAFLRMLVRLTRARRVLEIGTFTGYSALVMAEGLPPSGRLITCDIDPKATSVARAFWRNSRHGKKITLKLGPAVRTLKSLKGPFDLVFIDADKPNYVNYYELALSKLRRGGLIVADNVLWSGRVLKPKDARDRAIVRFNDYVRRDVRVEAVMLTVRDGITLAVKL